MKRDLPFRHPFPAGKAPRPAPPPDITIIVGSNISRPEEYREKAQAEGLDLELVTPGAQHVYQAISDVQQQRRLGGYCVLDAHGSINNGQHVVGFAQGSVNTLTFLRHIRAGRQCQETMIHLHSCSGAHVRDALRSETGPHLICGGKKLVLSRLGRNTIFDMMRFLGEKKRNPDAAPTTPQAIFDRASQFMGDTVTLVGKDIGCHIRYAKLPGDLAGAGYAKIQRALVTRINIGKLAPVSALLDHDPRLLDGLPEIGISALRFAWSTNKNEIVTELVRREASWDRDIALMVPVGAAMPHLLPALALALCKSADRLLAYHAAQEPALLDQHALDGGAKLFMELAAELNLGPIEGVLALCGTADVADTRSVRVLRYLLMHLSGHLSRQAGNPVAQQPGFGARLARHCCLALLDSLPADGTAMGLRHCLDTGSLHSALLVIRRFAQLFPDAKSAGADAWIRSVEPLAMQQLLSVLRLPQRQEVLCGMLYCLGETAHDPRLAMQAVWQASCGSWQQRYKAERPGADVNEFLMDIVENAVHSLATMLPRAERAAYEATLTKDGGGPTEASVALLRELLHGCAPAAEANGASLPPLALSTTPPPASMPAAPALD